MLTDIPDARKARRLAPEALGSWYTLLGSFILIYALLFRYGYGCYFFQIGDYRGPTCAADPTLLSRLFPLHWPLIFLIVAPALALSAAFLALIRFMLTRPIGWTLFMVTAWGQFISTLLMAGAVGHVAYVVAHTPSTFVHGSAWVIGGLVVIAGGSLFDILCGYLSAEFEREHPVNVAH